MGTIKMVSINQILANIPPGELKKMCKNHELNSWLSDSEDENDKETIRQFLEKTKPPPHTFAVDRHTLRHKKSEDKQSEKQMKESIVPSYINAKNKGIRQMPSHNVNTLHVNMFFPNMKYPDQLQNIESQHVYQNDVINTNIERQHLLMPHQHYSTMQISQILEDQKSCITNHKTDSMSEVGFTSEQMKHKASFALPSTSENIYESVKKSYKKKIHSDQTADPVNISAINRFALLAPTSDSEDSGQECDENPVLSADVDRGEKEHKIVSVAKTMKRRKKKAKPKRISNFNQGEHNVESKETYDVNSLENINVHAMTQPPFLVRRRLRIKHPERGSHRYMPEGLYIQEELFVTEQFKQQFCQAVHEQRLLNERLSRGYIYRGTVLYAVYLQVQSNQSKSRDEIISGIIIADLVKKAPHIGSNI